MYTTKSFYGVLFTECFHIADGDAMFASGVHGFGMYITA